MTNDDDPEHRARLEAMAREAFMRFYDGQSPMPTALATWVRVLEVTGGVFADEWARKRAPGNVVGAYRWVAHEMVSMSTPKTRNATQQPRQPKG